MLSVKEALEHGQKPMGTSLSWSLLSYTQMLPQKKYIVFQGQQLSSESQELVKAHCNLFIYIHSVL